MKKRQRNLYYRCSECREPCEDVERDFGIGRYEYWGAMCVDTDIHVVSDCCDGELLDPEQYGALLEEEAEAQ